jgi:hypothetical protein
LTQFGRLENLLHRIQAAFGPARLPLNVQTMNNLKISAFLAPVIAFLLVIVLYILFRKKTSNAILYQKFIFLTTILAFLLNLAWELVQGPLYEGYHYNVQHIIFCALGAVADAIMVLLIYFGLALIFKNALWAQNLTISRILLVMVIGGMGAILSEKRHLAEGSWAYAASMPIIPIVDAGLSPVLQFTVLPVLIYFLSFHLLRMYLDTG